MKQFTINKKIYLFLKIVLVKWNEPYQKLASCDSSGVINVWAKFDCRWNVELINDRNTRVTYFSWSHDGRLALICYQVSIKIQDDYIWLFVLNLLFT